MHHFMQQHSCCESAYHFFAGLPPRWKQAALPMVSPHNDVFLPPALARRLAYNFAFSVES